jgi:hypothetical protein
MLLLGRDAACMRIVAGREVAYWNVANALESSAPSAPVALLSSGKAVTGDVGIISVLQHAQLTATSRLCYPVLQASSLNDSSLAATRALRAAQRHLQSIHYCKPPGWVIPRMEWWHNHDGSINLCCSPLLLIARAAACCSA